MNYLNDGYHFFTKIQSNDTLKQDNVTEGMSIFRRHGRLTVDVFPKAVSGARLALILDNAPGAPKLKNLGVITKGGIRVPFSSDMSKIIGAVIIINEKPALAALSKDVSLDVEKLFSSEKAPVSRPQEKPADKGKIYPFDPFGTTNPAYSWNACTSEGLFHGTLSERKITLPESLANSASSAFARYHHVLLGKYTEESSGREFFIIGIPTASSDVSCAYNEKYRAARFVEVSYPHGNTAYAGYHLYYIDKKSTALVKVVLKK